MSQAVVGVPGKVTEDVRQGKPGKGGSDVGPRKGDRGFRKIKAAEDSRLRLLTESEAELEANGAGIVKNPGEFSPLSRPCVR